MEEDLLGIGNIEGIGVPPETENQQNRDTVCSDNVESEQSHGSTVVSDGAVKPVSASNRAPSPSGSSSSFMIPSDQSSNNTLHSEALYTTPYPYDQMITDVGSQSSDNPASFLRDSIDSFIPTLTARHTLPDRTVASQVLMYRQLLHTACKPGLRLSRAYQGTPAQKAVMFMPWWEKNVAQTKRMVISYDNLTSRLWIYGAILPFVVDDNHSNKSENKESSNKEGTHCKVQREEALAAANEGTAQNDITVTEACKKHGIDCMMDPETGLPPIPHEFWVTRAGFQQEDPLTDFRSGGVLSLALLLHICESCPNVHARFIQPHGDASVLPFGITSINVTGMLARLCNFSKAVDKVDALMTTKPFWEGFRDPNFLLTLQEASMELLADVVVEFNRMKKWHLLEDNEKADLPSKMEDPRREVTVFDFPRILETTEKRVKDDLLGAGPRTVDELRNVCQRLRIRYARACYKKECSYIKRAQGSACKQEASIMGKNNIASSAFGAFSKMSSSDLFCRFGNNQSKNANDNFFATHR